MTQGNNHKNQRRTIDYRAPYLICTIVKKINGGLFHLSRCLSTVWWPVRYLISFIKWNNDHHPKWSFTPICKCVPFFQKLDKDAYRAQIKYSGVKQACWKIAIRWLDDEIQGRFQLMEQKLPEQKRTELEALKRHGYEESAEAHLESQSNLLSKEALSSKQYWKLFNFCLPHAFRFKVRTKNPGEGPYKCIVQLWLWHAIWGYRKMYHLLWFGSLLWYISCGWIRQKSLVYDMIEAFRSSVEQMVIEFLWTKKLI